MSTLQQSTFRITRDDRGVDPKTIITEGLKIGRLPDSDVWLNHPDVSRLHAGISEVERCFYLINLSGSSATTLNGRIVTFNELEALTAGDEIQIGPFFLHIEKVDPGDHKLTLRVAHQFALHVGERSGAAPLRITGPLRTTGPLAIPIATDAQSRSDASSEIANVLKIFWAKRTREKAGRPSPLHPRTPPRLGKARYNWMPTRDLVRPWPFAIFIWALIVVGSFSAVAAFTYKVAFAPQPLSNPHTSQKFTLMPAIAKQPNGNSCTSCHAVGLSLANREKMNANCAGCHQSEGFASTIIAAHREAGITCIACHSEHRGENFRPLNYALESCAKCHNDDNKRLYNGKGVHTPHGGNYGYPVMDGKWVWKGFGEEELEAKPELVALLQKTRADKNNPQQWRNAQFHAIHVDRVRVVVGVTGVDDDAGNQVMSCSSCHKTGYMGTNVDRAFPRTTCASCHNAQVFEGSTAAAKPDAPSCTSCHVQHIKDAHWAPALRMAQGTVPVRTAFTK